MAPTLKEIVRSMEEETLEIYWEVGRQLRKDERIQIIEKTEGGPDRKSRWIIDDAKFDIQNHRVVLDLTEEVDGV